MDPSDEAVVFLLVMGALAFVLVVFVVMITVQGLIRRLERGETNRRCGMKGGR